VDAASRDDRDLIRGFLEGHDEECFGALVARYRDRVLRLAASILGPGAGMEAEDVTQEVFVQVHRKLGTFRSESAFSTWLYRIAQRRALELRRRARYRHPHTHDAVLAGLAATTDDDGLTAAVARQRQLALYSAVEALKEPLRSTIYLHYWLDESIESIAELKGARPGTIKAQLHRGRKRLGTFLEAQS
jgi:RNA polymerase sigma-70 factor (ECF subfamily)